MGIRMGIRGLPWIAPDSKSAAQERGGGEDRTPGAQIKSLPVYH
jgi:hypothetical protein